MTGVNNNVSGKPVQGFDSGRVHDAAVLTEGASVTGTAAQKPIPVPRSMEAAYAKGQDTNSSSQGSVETNSFSSRVQDEVRRTKIINIAAITGAFALVLGFLAPMLNIAWLFLAGIPVGLFMLAFASLSAKRQAIEAGEFQAVQQHNTIAGETGFQTFKRAMTAERDIKGVMAAVGVVLIVVGFVGPLVSAKGIMMAAMPLGLLMIAFASLSSKSTFATPMQTAQAKY